MSVSNNGPALVRAVSQHTDTSKNTKAWAVSEHIDTSKSIKVWAVSQHIDTSKNIKAWALSQHIDTSKSIKATLKRCYALHNYVGTILSHDKILA